jgi:serine phosphatase RsbU (regulator of sigma subunit)/PAS domain-containing protein
MNRGPNIAEKAVHLIGGREKDIRWPLMGLALASLIAVIDVVVGGTAVLVGLLNLAPLLVAARAGVRETALVGAFALALAVVLGLVEGMFGAERHVIPVLVVTGGGVVAVWIAFLRERAERIERQSLFLAEATGLMSASLDYSTAVKTLARLAVPRLGDWCAIYELRGDRSIKQLAVAHVDPAKEELSWDLESRYPFHLDQPVGVASVIRTGKPELMREIPDSVIEALTQDEDHARTIRALGLRSAMLVPLRARDRTLGVMGFASAESGHLLGEDDLELAKSLAARAALAIDNARLYTEVRSARDELRRSRDEMEAVLQGVTSAIKVQNLAGRLVYANDAAARMLRFPSVENLLETPPDKRFDKFEIMNENLEPLSVDKLPGRVTLTGERVPDTVICLREKTTGDEQWLIAKARPIYDDDGRVALAVNIFDDITEQKRDELAQRFLSEASRALGASLERQAMLDYVAHLAVPTLADICLIHMAEESDSVKRAALAHADPSKIETVEELARSYPVDPDSSLGAANVIRTGESELYRDVSEELLSRIARDERHLELLRELAPRSLLVAPMPGGGRVVGAITLIRAESGRRFDARDLTVAEELGRRAGAAVENAWLYAERVHIAKTLQSSLLPPRLPSVPGVEVATAFRAAGKGYEVGGDFYDLFNTGAGWAIVIGDVCGKGPEAAALTGLARYTLRTASMQEDDPSRILALLSEAIFQQRSDAQFCTAAYGRLELEPVGARLTVSSGGHPLPLLLSEEGRVEQLGVPGTLLGAVPDTKLADRAVQLSPGEAVVFYTDGVIEAGNPRGAFGLESLIAVLENCSGLSAEEIAQRIESAVAGLEENPSDDVALLVLRVRE